MRWSLFFSFTVLLFSASCLTGCSDGSGRTLLAMPEGEEIEALRKLSTERLPPESAAPKR
ncbi:hypothetical protein Poly59_26550 [Rubripirellula reticaptiva]|uniref:Uncharacterized protein n=1 Tax=Rubripirellula reticaptiva TaxID=2528013 RepID=A0A5C6F9Y5_9BACT|nr:hypothetical protein Poly59_26550 [Rubripirellula reticaptiva]